MRVSAAVFRRGNSVLLMRRGAQQPMPFAWEYPGGKAEPGENMADCMRRELREELGIDVTDMRHIIDVLHNLDDGRELELCVFEILRYTGKITMSVHDDMHWVDMADLVAHPQLPADLKVSQYLAKNLCD